MLFGRMLYVVRTGMKNLCKKEMKEGEKRRISRFLLYKFSLSLQWMWFHLFDMDFAASGQCVRCPTLMQLGRSMIFFQKKKKLTSDMDIGHSNVVMLTKVGWILNYYFPFLYFASPRLGPRSWVGIRSYSIKYFIIDLTLSACILSSFVHFLLLIWYFLLLPFAALFFAFLLSIHSLYSNAIKLK